jgi:hypothetical protein
MGVSRTPLELAFKLATYEKLVGVANKDGVAKAALFVTTAIRTQTKQVVPSMRLSGVGRSGAKIGAGFDLIGVANPTALVRARGPFHLIERDTKPHTISPRARRRGGKAVRLADGSVRRSVEHPGTRGKHPFEKAVRASMPLVPLVYGREQTKALARVFG